MTHSYAILELPQEMFDHIAAQLRRAGYDESFIKNRIDMTGIAIRAEKSEPVNNPCIFCSLHIVKGESFVGTDWGKSHHSCWNSKTYEERRVRLEELRTADPT